MKKVVITLIVLAILGGWYYYFFASGPTITIPTTTEIIVGTGRIQSTVKAVGEIYPITESTFSFARQGTVSKISKIVGDTVQKGDIIAEVDATDAYFEIENAKISLSNAQNNYNKLFTDTSDTDRIRANNTLRDSEANRADLEQQLKDLMIEAKNAETSAEQAISEQTEKVALASGQLAYAEESIATDSDTDNLERDMTNAFTSADDILNFLDTMNTDVEKLLYLDARNTEMYGDLGANDPATKEKMQSTYTSLLDSYNDLKDELSELRGENPRTFDSTFSLTIHLSEVLEDYNTFLDLAIRTVDASPETRAFPATTQESIKAELQTYLTQVNAKISSNASNISTLKNYGSDDLQSLSDKNSLLQNQNALTQAENALESAKTALETTKRSYETKRAQLIQSIATQERAIELNQASLRDLDDGPDATDIASAKNAIRSAEISLEKAQLALADYQIIAPFEGEIQDIPWTVGSVTLDTEWISVLGNSEYEVQVLLDQIDVVKVRAGMSADIILDAFPNLTLTGIVSSVSGAPQESSNVVSYVARILLPPMESPIYSKMSATVTIITAEKENTLVVPTEAISTLSGKSFVTVIGTRSGSWWTPEKKEVTLGIANGWYTEILSGVTFGTHILSGDVSSESDTMSAGGVFWWSSNNESSRANWPQPPGWWF